MEINSNGYEYVDLELPSGTLWATCNVGASKPSDYGLYFQWGDIKGYTVEQVGIERGQKGFSWTDYKWNPSGDGYTFTKYDTVNTALDLEDDAAHVHMGGDWHMPIPEQIKELLNNTTTAWTTLDGVNGIKFNSKKDESKFIFIPAAGYVLDNFYAGIGNYGFIWTSMLHPKYVYSSQELGFGSNGPYLNGYNRDFGFSVRGVIG